MTGLKRQLPQVGFDEVYTLIGLLLSAVKRDAEIEQRIEDLKL